MTDTFNKGALQYHRINVISKSSGNDFRILKENLTEIRDRTFLIVKFIAVKLF